MTREQMARAVEDQAGNAGEEGAILVADELYAAAAELRKTCATCRWFENYDGPSCGRTIAMDVPADGSGFCHRHEAEPQWLVAAKAAQTGGNQ